MPDLSREDCTTVPIELHPTPRFYRHLDVLLEAFEEDDEFESDLANAVTTLQQSEFDRPFQRHCNFGSDFSYPINREFVLIFRRETDRDGQLHPIRVHFYLKTIERL